MIKVDLTEEEIRREIGTSDAHGERVLVAIARLDERHDRALYFINRSLPESTLAELAALSGCVFIALPGRESQALRANNSVIEHVNPRLAIGRVLQFVKRSGRRRRMVAGRFISANARISPLAHVHDWVQIEDGVTVEPFCTVGEDVTIARGSVVRSGARLLGRVAVGEECVVGENAVVGGEGFGIDQDEAGHNLRVPQLGGVTLGARVEIGALSTVCAGTLGPTVLGDHVKIDDRVHIAHNARLGRQCIVTAGAIIGGSVSMGDQGWVGLGAIVRDGVAVGHACLIGQGAVVGEDLPDHTIVAARPSPSQVAPRAMARTLLWASQRRNEE